ncbi:MAG: signal peptidase I [Dehalococcoidia bacterium]|nr:signal peptidase I [Dehalococcoidia bacterium]
MSPATRVVRSYLGFLVLVARESLVAVLVVLTVGIAAVMIGLRALGFAPLVVTTGSMQPTLPVGSVAIMRPVAADRVEIGDVIAFTHPQRPSEMVTHRVIGRAADDQGRVFFITQGDANPMPDPWQAPASGTGLRLVFVVPQVGGAIVALQQPAVLTTLIVLPAVLLVGLGSFVVGRRLDRTRRSES